MVSSNKETVKLCLGHRKRFVTEVLDLRNKTKRWQNTTVVPPLLLYSDHVVHEFVHCKDECTVTGLGQYTGWVHVPSPHIPSYVYSHTWSTDTVSSSPCTRTSLYGFSVNLYTQPLLPPWSLTLHTPSSRISNIHSGPLICVNWCLDTSYSSLVHPLWGPLRP